MELDRRARVVAALLLGATVTALGGCADREAQAAVLHRFPTSRPPTAERVRYRRCVRCGKMMNRVNFGRVSGTVLDVCRGHGTYLDTGELHQIVSFIHAGGLERARALQMEDLREREQRLRALEERADQWWRTRQSGARLDTGDLAAGALLDLIMAITDQ